MTNLLLSDAMILGDTMKKCDPETWISSDGSCGCAFGGALLADGVTADEFQQQYFAAARLGSAEWFADMPCIMSRWPWLEAEHLLQISELYRGVAAGMRPIEDVAAYVRTIEPPQPSSIPSPSFSDSFPQQQTVHQE